MQIRCLTLLIVLVLMHVNAYTQNLNIDSLRKVWNNATLTDVTRLEALQKISWDVYVFTQPDSAYYYAQIQYDFAEKKELKTQMASALHTQGTVFRIRGDYEKALESLLHGLKLYKGIDNKEGLAKSQNSIGIVYEIQGDYNKALDYYTINLNPINN